MPHYILKNEKYELFEPVIASWLHFLLSKTFAIHTHTSMNAIACSTHLQICFRKTLSHNDGDMNDSEEETTTNMSECGKRSLATVART